MVRWRLLLQISATCRPLYVLGGLPGTEVKRISDNDDSRCIYRYRQYLPCSQMNRVQNFLLHRDAPPFPWNPTVVIASMTLCSGWTADLPGTSETRLRRPGVHGIAQHSTLNYLAAKVRGRRRERRDISPMEALVNVAYDRISEDVILLYDTMRAYNQVQCER